MAQLGYFLKYTLINKIHLTIYFFTAANNQAKTYDFQVGNCTISDESTMALNLKVYFERRFNWSKHPTPTPPSPHQKNPKHNFIIIMKGWYSIMMCDEMFHLGDILWINLGDICWGHTSSRRVRRKKLRVWTIFALHVVAGARQLNEAELTGWCNNLHLDTTLSACLDTGHNPIACLDTGHNPIACQDTGHTALSAQTSCFHCQPHSFSPFQFWAAHQQNCFHLLSICARCPIQHNLVWIWVGAFKKSTLQNSLVGSCVSGFQNMCYRCTTPTCATHLLQICFTFATHVCLLRLVL